MSSEHETTLAVPSDQVATATSAQPSETNLTGSNGASDTNSNAPGPLTNLVTTIKSCFDRNASTTEEMDPSVWSRPEVHTDKVWGNPGVRQWLLGLYDASSPLRIISGKYDVLRSIVEFSFWNPDCIIIGDRLNKDTLGVIGVGRARFPPASSKPIDINMMPFNLRNWRDTLPKEVQGYGDMLFWVMRSSISSSTNTAYLTVQEGWVEPGDTQRRPGLHTDAPGNYTTGIGELSRVTYENMWWGGCDEGIFFANNIDNSCRVWNCRVRRVQSGYDAVGQFGDCEHLRPLLSGQESETHDHYGMVDPGTYRDLAGSMWYWMTDRTPHETLPVKERCWRQFIRVVVGEISVWYKSHSTSNPNCEVPKNVTILEGNKFKGRLKVVQQGDFVWNPPPQEP